ARRRSAPHPVGAGDRRGRGRRSGSARGAGPGGRLRVVPQRPPLHGGQVRLGDADRAGARGGRGRRGGRIGRDRIPARRPRDRLPLDLLRPLRVLPLGAAGAVHPAGAGAGGGGAAEAVDGWRAGPPVPPPLGVRRDDVGPRERAGRDPGGDAARPGGLDRLRGDDRAGRGLRNGEGAARRHSCRHRLRRGRAQLRPGGGDRRRRPGRRGRHPPLEAGVGPRLRRHRHGRCDGRRPGRAGARADRRRGGILVRGDRAGGDGRASVRDAAAGRHGDDHRDDPGGADDRPAGVRLPRREADPGEQHGVEPVPGRHAALRRPLPERAAEARRAGLGPDRARGDQRGVRRDAPGRGGAERDRVWGGGGV
ncbi:MAG: Alcohol dehydrogenase, partial [uncultured Thermomicrobiales bacterium]